MKYKWFSLVTITQLRFSSRKHNNGNSPTAFRTCTQQTVQFAVWGPWIFVNRLSEAFGHMSMCYMFVQKNGEDMMSFDMSPPRLWKGSTQTPVSASSNRPTTSNRPTCETRWSCRIRMAADKSRRGGYGCGYHSGSNTSLTEWKTIFPLCFSPHLPCFYKPPPPTYKGKLSTISIFRWFIAFGSGTSRGCANLCQGFWVGGQGGSPLSHQSSVRSCCCSHTCPDATDFAVIK